MIAGEPRYESPKGSQAGEPRYGDKTKRCPNCDGHRWSYAGECLNPECISDETRKRIFEPAPKKKR